jgi:polysaccharide biosynthesis protein PslH
VKILFLTPQSPYPPRKGTSTRNFNLIKEIASRHEVHLLTFTERPDGFVAGLAESGMPDEDRRVLLQFCASVHALPAPPKRSIRNRILSTLTNPLPDLALRLASQDFKEYLDKILANMSFDVLQVEGLEMAEYWLGLAGRGITPPAVLDAHNCEYMLQRRAFSNDVRRPAKWLGAGYSLAQWMKLRRYEAAACRAAMVAVAVSDNDRDVLKDISPSSKFVVVPNGVDAGYFHLGDSRRDQGSLVFTGTMDFRPNVDAVLWFCQYVLPLVVKEAPQTRFYIVGQRPTREVLALARIPGVIVTGAVDDVRPYLWQASVCVVPLRVGGGTRFKILEAMATGTPVVSTTLGAEGISLTPGYDALLADHPIEMADAISSLLREKERTWALAERGREFVLANYEWGVLGRRVLAVYDEVLKEPKSVEI